MIRRRLLLGLIGAIALVAGILLNRPPEVPAVRSVDINSPEALRTLLPSEGDGSSGLLPTADPVVAAARPGPD